MAFLQQEPSTFISVQLTGAGRRELALGRLNFNQAIVSDREINYEFNRRYPETTYFEGLNPPVEEHFDLSQNRVMEPHTIHPNLPLTNFDGTEAFNLESKVFVSKHIATASTESRGFWSGTSLSESGSTVNSYILDYRRYIKSGSTHSGHMDESKVIVNTTPDEPAPGNLVLLRYSWPGSSAPNNGSTAPFADLFYRVKEVNEVSNTMTVDRNIPNFNSDGSNKVINWYEYPWNGVETYYGSGKTESCPVWNLNIVRTSREIGQTEIGIGASSAHSYSSFASREYGGIKQYFGFNEELRQIGFIHYTNESTGNTYAEQLVPGATEVDMPHIMWHRKNVNPGQGELGGQRFTDSGSDIYYDSVSKTSYTLLKDGTSFSSVVVGRIYGKLKLIVITDPELLTAMSYKSNRNWTLPPLIVGSQSFPKAPATVDNTSGLLRSDYVYYVTYFTENNGAYVDGEASGYRPSMHCGYIQKIEGFTDEDGYAQYLTCSFPTKSFPYMRNSDGFTSFSGTGWSANKVQIIVQEVSKDKDKGLDSINPREWSGVSHFINGGNGVYSGELFDDTIDPTYLQGQQFIISLDDVSSGATQPNFVDNDGEIVTPGSPRNNIYGLTSGFTEGGDYINQTGLTYGNEDFFFGNINTKILSTTYKTVFTIVAKDTQLNSSVNGGFDGEKDSNTYITEIGITNDQGVLVAVGKPTYPIRKSSARYITFQLELDF